MRPEPLGPDAIRKITRKVDRTLRELGNADSDEMKAAGKTLKASFRKTLGKRGGARIAYSLKTKKARAVGGTPSTPGEAPRRQIGQLVRSVRDGVVGARRRVAVTWFTAPILEGGVNATLPLRSGAGRRRKAGQAKRTLRIAPRPFAQRSVDAVRDQLAGVIVDTAGARIARLERDV